MVNLSKIDLEKANLATERARIRRIRHDNEEEMRRLMEIDQDEAVKRFMLDMAEDMEDLVEFARGDRHYLGVAIEGKEGHVEPSEVGKLQGWVAVYPDHKKRLGRAGVVLEEGVRALEVGFARHPAAKGGQVASALRQVVKLLFEAHVGSKLVLTAYAEEENEGSWRVLEAAGFVRQGRVKYLVKDKTENWFYRLEN